MRLGFVGILLLHTQLFLSLSPLYGLLIRSGFLYVNVGILVYFKHALYNLYHFVK